MPMIKIGRARTYNGDERDIYLIQGNAARDGEVADARGKTLGKVSVAAKETDDGSTIFVTLCGWRGKAAQVAGVRKSDSVLAVGMLSSREYNGRTYYDMDVDFIALSGSWLGMGPGAQKPVYAAPANKSEPLADGFATLEDDAELPF